MTPKAPSTRAGIADVPMWPLKLPVRHVDAFRDQELARQVKRQDRPFLLSGRCHLLRREFQGLKPNLGGSLF